MNATTQKFQSLSELVCKSLHGATIERHSLSHALSGVPAPSEREPGGLSPFIRVLAKILRFGRFSSPL